MPSAPLNRARVETSIAIAKEVFRAFQVQLPGYAYWTTADWDRAGSEYDEVRDCMLGWDVTDFGSKDFEHIGRTLFTLRNGNLHDLRYPKSYAEKLILDPEGQRAPAHFHRTKREDIINRGGGNILVQLTRVTADDRPAKGQLSIQVDGCRRLINSGETVRLRPGESLCIPARTIHQFWGEEGTGMKINGIGYTVSGEVSSVCDDLKDNFFFADLTRFPVILEDAPRKHYLCNEYPAAVTVPAVVASV
jgi:D-lyxose ketol-isomerase